MSVFSLETLSKAGAVRLSIEVLIVFGVVTVTYVLALEPILRSVAPTVYVQPGLDYDGREFPNTASEVTHMLIAVMVVGSHLFWRINYTELGETLRDAVEGDYETNR